MRFTIAHAFIISGIAIISLTHILKENEKIQIQKPTPRIEQRSLGDADLVCLADNIYHEARGEPFQGKVAVAQVTLNRAKQTGQSLCAVVYAPKQFSWTHQNKKPPSQKTPLWQEAKRIAVKAHQGVYHIAELGDAYFFHTVKTKPYWSRIFVPIMDIGNHRFYRYGY